MSQALRGMRNLQREDNYEKVGIKLFVAFVENKCLVIFFFCFIPFLRCFSYMTHTYTAVISGQAQSKLFD
jgi:hypothetical protein